MTMALDFSSHQSKTLPQKKRLLLQEFQSVFSFHEFIARLCCHKTWKCFRQFIPPKHNKFFHILEIKTNHRQPQVPSIPALQPQVFESAQKCVGARQTVTTHSLNAKIV
jgi:hypothetical protein